jgi:hypothetical protein
MVLDLDVLDGEWAVVSLPPDAPVPRWASDPQLSALVRDRDELTVVTGWAAVPADVSREGPFAALKVRGPLDFALTGVLAALAGALAGAGVSLFAVSTFATDVLLVHERDRTAAVAALTDAGHRVHDAPGWIAAERRR